MKKIFLRYYLFVGLLCCGTFPAAAQLKNPVVFNTGEQAEITQLVQEYLQKGFTTELARQRAETIVRNKNTVSTRGRLLTAPPTNSLWINRDPANPLNPHPVYDTATPEDLIKKVLLADSLAQSRITNVSFTGTAGGANRSLAYFENGQYALDIPEGLILGTYDVLNAEAPNVGTGQLTGGTSLAGDPHLTTIATSSIHGGSILQFDFQPYSETVTFDFIFASEEYPDFSNGTVNDAFGFFIWETSTPGSFTNIALFPDGSPVTINNSNWGNTGSNTPAGLPAPLSDAVNPQWHVPNYWDQYASSDSIMEYDGRTIKLKASALNLDTTKTYTLKLAICNVGDNAYGSAVFLANLDLGTPAGKIETDFNKDGGTGWNTAWDDAAIARSDFYCACTQKITFDVIKSLTLKRFMHFDFTPASMRNYMIVDEKAFPDSVFIPKGSDTPVSMNFTVGQMPADMEGIECMIITYYADTAGQNRGSGDTTRLTFYNHPAYDINYKTPTVGYSGILELNLSGGTPWLMRSLDKGVSWKLASTPVSKSEIYNISLEDSAYIWLKEPNSCWDAVIPVGSSAGGTTILRQVTVPAVGNVVLSHSPGEYYISSMSSFSFTIEPTGTNTGSTPVVTTNRTSIPDSKGVVIEDIGDGQFRVTILYIQQNILINIDFTTANEQVYAGGYAWGNNGQLFIMADNDGEAAIYNATGMLMKIIRISAGQTIQTSLPEGFYIISINNKSYKIRL